MTKPRESIRLLMLNVNAPGTEQIRRELERIDLAFDVQVAKSQKEFIRKALKFKPSIVIVGQLPGDYTTVEAYQDMRKIVPMSFFLLILSGYSEEEMRNYSLSGIDAFLPGGNYSLLNLVIMHGFNRKNLEKTLLQSTQLIIDSQHRLRSVFNNNHNAIFIVNYKNEILDLNPAALSFLEGKKSESVLGHDMSSYFAKEDLKRNRAAHASAFRGKKNSAECAFTLSKKSVRQASVNYVPIKNDEGMVTSVMMICKDVTDTFLLQRKFKMSEDRFHALADSAPVGIYYNDAEGNCVFVNKKWIEYTGLTLHASLGKGWLRSVHPEDRERLAAVVEENRNRSTGYSVGFRVIHTSGNITSLRVEAVPFVDEKGKQQGYVGTILPGAIDKRQMVVTGHTQVRQQSTSPDQDVIDG